MDSQQNEHAGVAVIGSINMDIAATVERIPGPGETVLASGARLSPGGKGANQAVAAARAGGVRTSFIGAIGGDAHAGSLRDALERAGIDTSALTTNAGESGQALISVDSRSENAIVVIPGANGRFTDLTPAHCEAISRASVLLAQLEIPVETVLAAARKRREGTLFVLNAAPARPLPPDLLQEVDVLVVNEHEAREIAGQHDMDRAIGTLLDQVPAVLVTLGSDGSRLVRRGGYQVAQPAFEASAIDTTAAGDTFCGVLAAAWACGLSDAEALRRAAAAAALTVTRHGAQDSIPGFDEVASLIARREGASR